MLHNRRSAFQEHRWTTLRVSIIFTKYCTYRILKTEKEKQIFCALAEHNTRMATYWISFGQCFWLFYFIIVRFFAAAVVVDVKKMIKSDVRRYQFACWPFTRMARVLRSKIFITNCSIDNFSVCSAHFSTFFSLATGTAATVAMLFGKCV